MKKHRLFCRICTIALACLLGVTGVVALADSPVRQEGLNIADMLREEVAAQGAAVEKSTMTFQFFHGDFLGGGELVPFTNNAGTDFLGNPDVADSPVIWAWQWRANGSQASVVKVTAKYDMLLNIGNPSDFPDSQWALDSAYYVYTENASGEKVQVKKIAVEASFDKSRFVTDVHLAAGDSLYYVYQGNPGIGLHVANNNPWFNSNLDAYDESQRTVYTSESSGDTGDSGNTGNSGGATDSDVAVGNDYLEHAYMVSQQVLANGAAVERDLVSFQFLFGDFASNSLTPFKDFVGQNTASEGDDVVGLMDGTNVIWRWQWRFGSKNTVLKITAKENIKLDLSAFAVAETQWALGSAYNFYVESASGARVLVKTLEVTEKFDTKAAELTVHLAAGQKLYVVYGNSSGQYSDDGPATSTYIPVYNIDAAKYDASKSVNFGDSPNTGDNSYLLETGVVMMLSMLVCGGIIISKKRFAW